MKNRIEADFDVVVCGGGAAGIGAAVGAAKAGARVCLVEKYGFLGGAATTSQVLAYCGLFQQGHEPVRAVAGVAQDLVDELKTGGLDGEAFRSETTGNWIVLLDPEVLKFSLDRLVLRHGIDVRLHTRVAAATRTGKRIEAVTLAGMDGREHVVADAFVDASGDANLAMLAGVDYRVGDLEGRLQALTMPIRIGGIAPDLKIDRARLQSLIAAYNEQGAYPIQRTDGGIIIRLPLSRDMWWMTVDLAISNLKSESFSRAEMEGRAMAHDYLDLLRKGMPGFENAYLVATGPQVGIRETRHPQARLELTARDVLEGTQSPTSMARAAWPSELHGEAGKPVYTPVGGRGYFQVPYDAIRAASLDNLWYGGRLIGADPQAYGSVRVMGTAFATGEAAGVAAADYVDGDHRIDAASVQKRLLAQGALI
ncbi:FAD-dependent oxidoreductase [Mesorhizobium xinjiangense]|uniref:FAD-dependent oxidoreductase n=1 Tax=Mesorhizobium xinjiangense TaxID=2678685 RepID=UPI0012ED690B|nr:FAD-dependent oxidoreductase [Mesorhizobium xinjiangense]